MVPYRPSHFSEDRSISSSNRAVAAVAAVAAAPPWTKGTGVALASTLWLASPKARPKSNGARCVAFNASAISPEANDAWHVAVGDCPAGTYRVEAWDAICMIQI